jgi:hypothetical protein
MKGDLKMRLERAPGLEYEVDNLEVEVFDVGGNSPTTIIRTSQAWQIQADWEAVGVAVAFYGAVNFTVDAYLESIGPGAEVRLGPVAGAIVPGTVNYNAVIPVVAGNPPIPAGQDSATFKLTTTITFRDLAGNPVPMAAFVEGPILQFYQ